GERRRLRAFRRQDLSFRGESRGLIIARAPQGYGGGGDEKQDEGNDSVAFDSMHDEDLWAG
ncbi:MAG: hypothetical protein CMJ87_11565, partial [Planctomycetes bacterium]|nr:hypothetical protein [Planctomycetota bacterium]